MTVSAMLKFNFGIYSPTVGMSLYKLKIVEWEQKTYIQTKQSILGELSEMFLYVW